jgi:hypothetical protein
MSRIFSGENTPANAITIKKNVSTHCETMFERVDAMKKFEKICFARKNTQTSISSDVRNAKSEAIPTRNERENMASYDSPIRA